MNDWKDLGNQSQSMNNSVGNVTFGDGKNEFTFAPTQIIQISADKIKLDKLNPISPYRGLKPFENNEFDSNLFFGRDQLILRLMENLTARNLVLLLGASGSGKSSVVKAGLIPQLRTSLGTKFCELIFKPSQNPFSRLFVTLSGKFDDEVKESIVMSGQPETLIEIVSTLKKPEDYWLIYIDQFEELFTRSEPDKRDNFIQGLGLLYQSLRESQSQSVKIVMTMRADFLDRFDPFPVLGEITRGNIELITTMYEDELRQAIEQPAAKHGVVFQDGLVKRVIEEIKGQSGSLPLLQYTLDLLWKRDNIADPNDLTKPHPLTDRELNIDTYNSLGGVRGALQSHIEEVYTQKLKTSAQREATRQIFLKLVQWILGEGGQYIPVSQPRLRSDFEIGIEVETLDIFINERLIVSNVDNLSQRALQDGLNNKQQATVEIAHEILISAWERLKEWIGEAKDVLIAKSQLQADMARYEDVFKNNQARANDELLVGSRLEKVLELWDEGMFELRNIPLESEEIKFIEKSIEWRDRQIHEKEEQIQELNQAITEATLRAQSSRVKDIINSDPLNGIVHAIQEVGINLSKLPNRIIDSVQSNLLDAIEISREANSFGKRKLLSMGKEEIIAVSLPPEGSIIGLNMGGKEIPRKLTIWNSLGDATEKELEMHQDIKDTDFTQTQYKSLVAISRDTLTIASVVHHDIYIFNRKEFSIVSVLHSLSRTSSVSVTSDGSRILSVSDDSACLWDREGNLLKELHTHNNDDENLRRISSGAISDSGKLVALGYESGFLIFLDGQLNPLDPPFKAHENSVHKIEISQNEEIIVSGGRSDQVKLWNRKGELLNEPLGFVGHHNVIVSISPDNRYIAASSLFENNIYLWDQRILDIKGTPTLKILKGSGASSLNFSSNSEILVSGNSNGEIKLWDVRSELLARLPKTRSATPDETSISFDGKYIGQTQGSQVYGNELGHLWDLHGNLVGQSLQKLTCLLEDSILNWSKTNSITNINNNEQYCLIYGIGFWTWWFASLQSNLREHKISPPLFGNEDERDWSAGSERRRSLFFFIDSNLALVAISLDQQTIVSLTTKGLVQIWDKQLNIIDEFSVDCNEKLTAIAISHDGQVIATSSKDKTVKLWDRNGNLIAPPLQHEYPVISVTFSTSGETIISHSQSDDNVSQSELQLWNRQGQSLGQILRLKYDGNPTLAVSPDHSYIVTDNGVITDSPTRQGELRLWRVGQIMDWLQIACNRLKNHPVLKNPKSQQALAAREVCRKYVWYPKAEELNQQGLEKLRVKEYQDSIKLFTESIDYNCEHIEAHYNRGRSYGLLGAFDKATKDFSQAIEFINFQLKVLNICLYYAVRFQPKKRRRYTFNPFFDLAEEYIIAICFLQNKPNLADVYFYRGGSYSKLHNLQQAKADWQVANKLYRMQMSSSANVKKVQELLKHPSIVNLEKS